MSCESNLIKLLSHQVTPTTLFTGVWVTEFFVSLNMKVRTSGLQTLVLQLSQCDRDCRDSLPGRNGEVEGCQGP